MITCLLTHVTVLFYSFADCDVRTQLGISESNIVHIMYLYLICSMSYGVNLYLDLRTANKFNSVYSGMLHILFTYGLFKYVIGLSYFRI
jgi:hypothetical protein